MSDSNSSRQADLPALSQSGGAYDIEHRPTFTRPRLLLLKVTAPLILFACLFAVYTLFFSGGAMHSAAPVTVLACQALAIALVGSYMAVLSTVLKNKFVLRRESIAFPALYFIPAGGRLKRDWSELQKVTFARRSADISAADQIVMSFQGHNEPDTTDLFIKLKEIEPLELKKLVYAIVTNAPHATFEPPLNQVALEFPTVSGIKHVNFQNFTSLWEEEFSTRFSPTLFVPLSPSARLRGGTIEISELVACGGSAAIYAAKDNQGTWIIVKEAVIPSNSSETLKTKALELFNREALLLSRLDHPHIAKVLDHFVENEHHYEVIEYIDGLDMRRFVKERGPQPLDFVLNWAQQICEILIYLHSQAPPVIHRDLTPDNLVLKVDGQLVLIDFGAANAFVGTATGTMVGKQSYMPPEQIRGKASPQSDIYALGCTCYYLLTGKDPCPLEVSSVDAECGLSQELNPFLAGCTEPELSRRFASADTVLAQVRALRQKRQLESISKPAKTLRDLLPE